ncbi:hypothetical protein D3C84_1118600 [compost metagenome]
MISAPLAWMATAFWNIISGLKPTVASTMKAMKLAPPSRMTALMICTQVVASMPPKVTYITIRMPTRITAEE